MSVRPIVGWVVNNMTLVLLATMVAIWGIVYLLNSKRKSFVALINQLPGPPATFPLLGNALDMMVPSNRVIPVNQARNKKYGSLYRTWIGPKPEIHTTKAEHIEIILRSEKYIEKSTIYRFLEPWFGKGLLTSTGDKWRSRRKMITPTFHFKILESFVEVFVDQSQVLVGILRDQVSLHGDRGFDIYPFMSRGTLDIICQTAMGTDIRAQEGYQADYVQAVEHIAEETVYRLRCAYLYPDIIYYNTARGRKYKHSLHVMHSFTLKMIQKRLDENANMTKESATSQAATEDESCSGKKKRMAFLDLMIAAYEGDNQFSIQDLHDEVNTFMVGGHETTNASTCWALFMIASHPDVQNHVIEELEEIFQQSDRRITMQDFQHMKYLERVIKESLRLYPAGSCLMREIRDDVTIGGFKIPSGCSINMHIYQLHRDPEVFPDPETFNPDNFLPERVKDRHPYAYLPFSAGPRNCIGQKFAMLEMKTMIASILRNFTVRAVHDRKTVGLVCHLVLRPEQGIKLVLTPREKLNR